VRMSRNESADNLLKEKNTFELLKQIKSISFRDISHFLRIVSQIIAIKFFSPLGLT
jgi:thermostable 8-oxoguanine DNA glycosylase